MSESCRNNHPPADRIYTRGRWRCPYCVEQQNIREKQQKRVRDRGGYGGKALDENGCIRVCLCEEL